MFATLRSSFRDLVGAYVSSFGLSAGAYAACSVGAGFLIAAFFVLLAREFGPVSTALGFAALFALVGVAFHVLSRRAARRARDATSSAKAVGLVALRSPTVMFGGMNIVRSIPRPLLQAGAGALAVFVAAR
jgi:hypothetical protein